MRGVEIHFQSAVRHKPLPTLEPQKCLPVFMDHPNLVDSDRTNRNTLRCLISYRTIRQRSLFLIQGFIEIFGKILPTPPPQAQFWLKFGKMSATKQFRRFAGFVLDGFGVRQPWEMVLHLAGLGASPGWFSNSPKLGDRFGRGNRWLASYLAGLGASPG